MNGPDYLASLEKAPRWCCDQRCSQGEYCPAREEGHAEAKLTRSEGRQITGWIIAGICVWAGIVVGIAKAFT